MSEPQSPTQNGVFSVEKADKKHPPEGASQGYVNPAYQVDGVEGDKPVQNGVKAPPGVGKTEVDESREARRNQKPLFFCRLLTSYPKLAFGLTLGGHIFFLLITAVLVRTGYDILPITFDRLPLDILDDVDYLRGLAWFDRDENINVIKRLESESVATTEPERSEIYEFVELFFEQPGGNVFTRENLMKIQEVENDFQNDQDYQSKICYLGDSNTCVKPQSVIRYFDGSKSSINPIFNDPNFDNVEAVLKEAYSNNRTKREFRNFLGKYANGSAAISEITRVAIYVGYPLKGFKNTTDREEEQEKEFQEFMFNNFMKKGDYYFKHGAGTMDFVYSSGTLIFTTLTRQVFLDLALAIGSLAFIIFIICFQTGSLWVGLFAVFSIVASFLGANLIYRVIFDFKYFGIFHVMAVFIILGIGADDVFVFFDTWKETAHHQYPSLAHRLSDCYRKAAMAMLFTSLTTFIAFVVSATSPFLGINSFGVFSSMLIFVNYISVVTFFPAVVVTYHLNWEKYKCCCCCVKPASVHSAEGQTSATSTVQRKNIIVRFFRGPYFSFVTHPVARWCIVVFFMGFIALFVYFAAQLKVNEEQIKFLKDSSNIGRYLILRANAFNSDGDATEQTQVHLVWGLKEQDLSGCHKTDPSCTGVTVWDDKFNLNSPTAQTQLLDLCHDLKNLPAADVERLRVKLDVVTGLPEVLCFMEAMETFYAAEGSRTIGGTARYPSDTVFNIPITASDVTTIMTYNSLIYSQTVDVTNATFSIGESFWMHNGFQLVDPGNQLNRYDDLIGETRLPQTVEVTLPLPNGEEIAYNYPTRIRYAAIIVNTTLVGSVGYPSGIPVRDSWEEWMQTELEGMDESLKGGFQTTPPDVGFNLWHWLKVQKVLVSSAILGMIIGVSCALPVLILATHNVITGFCATVTIVLITTCVLGVIPMSGWKLGLLESLNLVLVVGLSVDYVVHLAEGYSRSAHTDRLGRVHDMLEEVGISVLSGATTTLGASTFLLFAQILFFTQFGLFMFSTIGLSILFALGFFTTMMGIMGPQNEFGSLRPLYRAIQRKCCKSQSEEIST